MAKVEKVTPAMFDDIYPLLLELDDSQLTGERWRLIFDYRWEFDEGHVGYALIDDRQVVGFNGTLFSRRTIDGIEARFCNLTSWIVKEKYRTESLRLVFPLLHLKGYTLTNLTMNERAWAIAKRLGFKNLDTHVRLLFPIPQLSSETGETPVAIVSDQAKIAEILNQAHLRIFSDHSQYDCGHLVIQEKDSYCYLLYTSKSYKKYNCKIPYGHIQYISDRGIFLKHLSRIRVHFLTSNRYLFLAVDERLIGNAHLPYSKIYQLKIPKMYKSEVLTGEQVDNLYSEIVVLGL
jgi:hypothetical protein